MTFKVPVRTTQGIEKVAVELIWKQGGLCVHRLPELPLFWSITHVQSGRTICRTRRKATALKAAAELLLAGDWTQPRTKVVKDAALHDVAKAIAEKL